MCFENYRPPVRGLRASYGKKLIRLLLIIIALVTLNYDLGFAADAPAGFYLVQSQNGVQLYRKDYPGGAPDFVQVVDLSMGAAVKPLHGALSDPGVGQGVYGGNDAHFRSRSLADYWRSFMSDNPTAFCITNGQFFYMLEYPTRLPFPLKVNGDIITDGYGIKDFPGKKLMLELWPGRADIVPLGKDALLNSTAPDIIAGLTEDAPKRIKFAVGRTFFGVADKNGDGTYKTILVFNSRISRQEEAANVLRSFGAEKVMMLDGGGSTQLSCQGKSYVYSDRLIPQAIGIMAAPAGSVAAAEPTPLTPPPRLAITSPKQPSGFPSSDGDVASSEKPLPATTAVEMAQIPAATLSGDTPTQTPQVAASTPNSAPMPTSIPESEVGVSLTQVQSTSSVLAPTPTAASTQAASPFQEGANALALLKPHEIEKQQIAAASISKSTPPNVQIHTGGNPSVQIVDIVWVPASMSPILLILLIMVHKIRATNT
jgi:hypothetical protein